jgi:hypothetical protein
MYSGLHLWKSYRTPNEWLGSTVVQSSFLGIPPFLVVLEGVGPFDFWGPYHQQSEESQYERAQRNRCTAASNRHRC